MGVEGLSDGLRLSFSAKHALITVERPQAKNAIDLAAMDRLSAIVDDLEQRDDLRAAILTGAGGIFISGGDLKDFVKLEKNAHGRAMSKHMQHIVERFSRLPFVTIAALDGDAIGGGVEIALACDIRVIRGGSRFCFKQNAMGLTPGWGGGQRLSRLVGASRALLLFSTCAEVGAEEALALGLAERVSEDSALEEALRLVSRIEQSSNLAVRNTKAALMRGRDMALSSGLELESELFAQTWGSEDHARAVQRFFDKRSGKNG